MSANLAMTLTSTGQLFLSATIVLLKSSANNSIERLLSEHPDCPSRRLPFLTCNSFYLKIPSSGRYEDRTSVCQSWDPADVRNCDTNRFSLMHEEFHVQYSFGEQRHPYSSIMASSVAPFSWLLAWRASWYHLG